MLPPWPHNADEQKESMLGSMISDSVLSATKKHGVDVSFVNSGGIRSGLTKGEITNYEIMEVLPFNDKVSVIDIVGSDLLMFMEQTLIPFNTEGDFMQVAGAKYCWSQSSPKGKKIKFFKIEKSGEYVDLQPNSYYRIAIPEFVKNKGILRKYSSIKTNNDIFVRDSFQRYISNFCSLSPVLEGRIKNY